MLLIIFINFKYISKIVSIRFKLEAFWALETICYIFYSSIGDKPFTLANTSSILRKLAFYPNLI